MILLEFFWNFLQVFLKEFFRRSSGIFGRAFEAFFESFCGNFGEGFQGFLEEFWRVLGVRIWGGFRAETSPSDPL